MVNIQDNLYGNNIFEAIKCISNLDDQSLLESFDKEIDLVVSKSVNLPTKFKMNEVYSKNFINELRKMVTMETNDIKMRNDDFEKMRMSNKKDYNALNGMKSYFIDKFKNS